jgi:hypothetical protein
VIGIEFHPTNPPVAKFATKPVPLAYRAPPHCCMLSCETLKTGRSRKGMVDKMYAIGIRQALAAAAGS